MSVSILVIYRIIQSHKQAAHDINQDKTNWVENEPYYNATIYKRLYNIAFDYFYKTERKDRYEFICALDAYEKKKY